MAGVNKAIVLGHLGADPELRYTPAGLAIASLRIATSETWKDKQTGEKQERTEWHRVEAFGRLAEIIGEYLKKGAQIYVEGKLRTDEYEKDGVKRWSTKIIAGEMRMLGKQERATGAPRSSGKPAGQQPPPPEDDDEIPFD